MRYAEITKSLKQTKFLGKFEFNLLSSRGDDLNSIWSISKIMLPNIHCFFLDDLSYSTSSSLAHTISHSRSHTPRSVASLLVILILCIADPHRILGSIFLLDYEIRRSIQISVPVDILSALELIWELTNVVQDLLSALIFSCPSGHIVIRLLLLKSLQD